MTPPPEEETYIRQIVGAQPGVWAVYGEVVDGKLVDRDIERVTLWALVEVHDSQNPPWTRVEGVVMADGDRRPKTEFDTHLREHGQLRRLRVCKKLAAGVTARRAPLGMAMSERIKFPDRYTRPDVRSVIARLRPLGPGDCTFCRAAADLYAVNGPKADVQFGACFTCSVLGAGFHAGINAAVFGVQLLDGDLAAARRQGFAIGRVTAIRDLRAAGHADAAVFLQERRPPS